jgi:hypothetical protein
MFVNVENEKLRIEACQFSKNIGLNVKNQLINQQS